MMEGGGGEAKYMSKKVKTGEIEVDLESKTIIVNYEVEATVLGSNGEPMLCEKKNNQKRYFFYFFIFFADILFYSQ